MPQQASYQRYQVDAFPVCDELNSANVWPHCSIHCSFCFSYFRIQIIHISKINNHKLQCPPSYHIMHVICFSCYFQHQQQLLECCFQYTRKMVNDSGLFCKEYEIAQFEAKKSFSDKSIYVGKITAWIF